MKPAFLVGAAAVAIVAIAAIAFAVADDDGDDDGAQAQSPTPARSATPAQTSTPTAPIETPPLPTAPGGDTPVTSIPEPTAGPGTPTPPGPSVGPVVPEPTPTLPAGRHAEPAPIDELDVRIAESFPPQYFVYILAGLPNGCAEQYTHSFTRDGNVIEIEVLNSFPDGAVACTAIYGQYEVNIALGSDFVPGETYTVSVNDGAAETEFTAQ